MEIKTLKIGTSEHNVVVHNERENALLNIVNSSIARLGEYAINPKMAKCVDSVLNTLYVEAREDISCMYWLEMLDDEGHSEACDAFCEYSLECEQVALNTLNR